LTHRLREKRTCHPDPAGSDLPHVLLVNPWIHDFAAYDFWAKPFGLLSLAAILQAHDVPVSYVDCLDRFHPRAAAADPHARHGRGPYLKTPIAPPAGLAGIGRTFSRYGIDPEWLRQDLAAMTPPDLILVTSLMTYWYPGVIETIQVLKQQFAQTPVVLGGIYARLCTEHARRHSGADDVVVDRGESIFQVLHKHTGCRIVPRFDLTDFTFWPYPAFGLQKRINYIPLLTVRGCPFDCAYCASSFLEPRLQRRSAQDVIDQIAFWHHRHGVVDFAFYDDALLWNAETSAVPLLEGIIASQMKLYFHTPNAVHIRAITADVAGLMKNAGFHTLRLGLETTAFESRTGIDNKVTAAEFHRTVSHLKSAGFDGCRIGAYLLLGLPGQSISAVESSIRVVKAAGITPVLAYYTPIPHTKMWPQAVAESRYDLEADPIFTNNAILPCLPEEFSWQTLSRLKQLANA
jgi:radical SAM superfamily enzyme YgiQ (UPF0313 family)